MRIRLFATLAVGAFAFGTPVVDAQLKLDTGKLARDNSYAVGGDFRFLHRAYVRRELGLSKEQEEKLAIGRRKLEIILVELSPKERNLPRPISLEKLDELYKPYHDLSATLVNDVLSQRQRDRLLQLVYQLSALEPFFRKEVQGSLQLNDKQIVSIRKLFPAYLVDLTNLTAKDQDSPEKLVDLDKRYVELALEQITAEQRERWKLLIGTAIKVK